MNNRSNTDGFSVIELLIALFIASIFLLGGYQLATYVVRSGADAEQLSKASNIAHDYLRRYSVSSDTCSQNLSLVPNTTTPDNADGLPNAKVGVTRTCPNQSEVPSLSKITATVTFGPSNSRSVTHAIFVE